MGGNPDELNAPFVFGASVAGPLHVREGIPCQDRAAHALTPSGVVVAVADGLGSAPFADEGAAAAVEAAVRVALGLWETSDLLEIPHSMAIAAREALEYTGHPLKSVACTFVGIAATSSGLCVAHVGDGAVVARNGTGPVLVSGPGASEYANETDSLATDGWEALLRHCALGDVDCFAAMTDGCQRAGLRFGEPHDGFFGPLFDFAREATCADEAGAELQALLSGPKMSEHSEDDKTLVLVRLR